MSAEIGHFALVMALAVAIVQGVVPIIGTQRNLPELTAIARPAATTQFLLMLLSLLSLAYVFATDDFSVIYAAQNSNSALPMVYKISAVWGGHEGSLLLWAFMLSMWGAAVAYFSKSLPQVIASRVLAIIGLICIGFILFLLFTSNPFDRVFPAPLDGRDLNPLLQDPGLIIHPPMLYMGYVGFVVPFAFVIAALIDGKLDAAWARWSRPWTAAAWMFLTLGIAIGSWWAYYELGWGGWWFWDPVENASFLPWLLGTALLHSLAVTEKRGAFKNWTVLLAIFTFSLSLLGTFLVRSGVLVSVHAFATDPARGVFVLAFLGVVVGSSLLLYSWRAPTIGSGGKFSLFSRETMLLLNNLLLSIATVTVLLGTLYPLLLDALGSGKISVGPPYFDTVFAPVMLPLAFMMGIGIMLRWKKNNPKEILSRSIAPAVIAVIAAPIIIIKEGTPTPYLLLGVAIGMWIIITSLQDLVIKANKSNGGLLVGLGRISRSHYGMLTAHIGVGIFIIGVGMTNVFSVEKDVRMSVGSDIEMGGYSFKLTELKKVQGPNYIATQGAVNITKESKFITTLTPEKRIYTVQTMPMTEASIDPGLFRDLYVALGEPLEGGDHAWAMRIYYKPFIRWIWLGTLFMAFGGLLVTTDSRYKK